MTPALAASRRTATLAGRGSRRPGRPQLVGFCTLCGTQVLRSQAVLNLPGAFLCRDCARTSARLNGLRPLPSRGPLRSVRAGLNGGHARRREEPPTEGDEELDGMVRKNLTITSEEDQFLQRHREINQSALFRRAIVMLMEAEGGPRRRRGGGPS